MSGSLNRSVMAPVRVKSRGKSGSIGRPSFGNSETKDYCNSSLAKKPPKRPINLGPV